MIRMVQSLTFAPLNSSLVPIVFEYGIYSYVSVYYVIQQ